VFHDRSADVLHREVFGSFYTVLRFPDPDVPVQLDVFLVDYVVLHPIPDTGGESQQEGK
jgi:hypothetical protein